MLFGETEKFGSEVPCLFPTLPGSLTTTNPKATTLTRTRRSAMVQPKRIHIGGNQEFQVGCERFLWARATPSEWWGGGRRSGAPSGNPCARTENRSIRGAWSVQMQAHEESEHPQQEQNSRPHPEPLALHCPRASRARRKLRSLFISASSRKHSCSSCQAATPSRVASSAPFGT